MEGKKVSSIGIIPARYGSTRFPGKPLIKILGKTLLQRTYENARHCALLKRLIVATDDARIYQHVHDFGGEAVLTSHTCATGTDRLAEAYFSNQAFQSDIIVNIQGDEPCLDVTAIEKVISLLIEDHQATMATAATIIQSEAEAINPNVVKCVFDKTGKALYFSRALIPSNKNGTYDPSATYYKHLGLYAYRPQFLKAFQAWPKTTLQINEDLEQLKVLEHGGHIKVALASHDSYGVDTPEDILTIEKLLCK